MNTREIGRQAATDAQGYIRRRRPNGPAGMHVVMNHFNMSADLGYFEVPPARGTAFLAYEESWRRAEIVARRAVRS